MRSETVRGVGFALLIVGVVTTAWSVYSGLTRFYLVVIVPVFTSDNVLGMLPLLAIFVGVLLLALAPAFGDDDQDVTQTGGSVNQEDRQEAGRTKVGGVLLIGPIPIVFGSDKKMALISAAFAIMIMAIIILLLL